MPIRLPRSASHVGLDAGESNACAFISQAAIGRQSSGSHVGITHPAVLIEADESSACCRSGQNTEAHEIEINVIHVRIVTTLLRLRFPEVKFKFVAFAVPTAI